MGVEQPFGSCKILLQSDRQGDAAQHLRGEDLEPPGGPCLLHLPGVGRSTSAGIGRCAGSPGRSRQPRASRRTQSKPAAHVHFRARDPGRYDVVECRHLESQPLGSRSAASTSESAVTRGLDCSDRPGREVVRQGGVAIGEGQRPEASSPGSSSGIDLEQAGGRVASARSPAAT